MRRPAAVALVLALASATSPARADEPAAAAPSPDGPALSASPAPAAPRFRAHPVLLEAHLVAGIEPHGVTCGGDRSATCQVPAFGVGGSVLWRGLVGPSVGLFASVGSPIVTANAATDPSLGDRVSVTLALAVRPLALLAWRRGDDYLARLLGGIGLEAGPSLEYLRTSSIPQDGCDITPTRLQPGFHGAAYGEVPVLGDVRSGWLSLRVMGRLIANAEAALAPAAGCRALVVMPALSGQLVFGLAYSM